MDEEMKRMTRLLLAIHAVVALLLVAALPCQAAAQKPNIVLILADDLGFSDLGCYGSEIHTPNLDKLAASGLRFTEFYNSARCCPSRASLLTGLYPHEAGIGDMTADQKLPGYRGHLVDSCVTLPEVLKPAGYHTLMAGKWHVGEPGPVKHGFDEFYGFTRQYGLKDNFVEKECVRLPEGHPKRTYAPGKFYSTDVYTDYALDFIAQARKAGGPYFLYLAYNSPHFPLQAPKEEIAKYENVYTVGWDKIREQRYEQMKKLGILANNQWPLTPRSPYWTQANKKTGVNPAWDSLDTDRRADLARRMAIFAAMVDRMDQNIGRVIEDLRKNNELDNTLVLFLSDNGACAEWDPMGFDENSGPKNTLHTGAGLDSMGGPGSYLSYGSAWANACNTPWRLYKHYANEGGISTPLIVHWPAGTKRTNEIDHRPGHIVDVMATLAEVAGATYPKKFNGHDITPAEGNSLLPALHGEAAKDRAIYFEHEHNRAVRQGKWKLVSVHPAGDQWELYDMEADRSEMNNLAAKNPEMVKQLSQQWEAWAKRTHVEPYPVKKGGGAGE
jgi:arylsulfatase